MKKFICGEIRFATSEFKGKTLLLPIRKSECLNRDEEVKVGEKLLLQKKNRDEAWDISRKYKDLFNPTKQTHGFSAMCDDEYVYISFHTTRPESNIWGYLQENITMGDLNTPIAGMNKIQKVRISVFNKFFQVFEPDKMFKSIRYKINNEEDLCYYAYLGFWRSILHSEEVVVIDENSSQEIRIIIEDTFDVNERGLVKLPAQIFLEKWDNNILEDVEKELSLLKSGQISKSEMVNMVRGNFKDFFKNI